MNKKQFVAKVKAQTNKAVNWMSEHPIETLMIATTAVTLVTRVINTAVEAKNANSWEREVARRERKTYSQYDR